MLVFAPAASAAWDGTSVSAALVGAGTEFDPYLISNENDLAYLAKQVNDGVTHYDGEFFKLMVDLDLGQKDWTPIGALSANYFGGNFDGDGHTIRGLKVKTDANDKKALYGGLIGSAACITVSYGDLNTEASMFNCFVTGIVINDPTECPNVGVLMGYVNDTFHFNLSCY